MRAKRVWSEKMDGKRRGIVSEENGMADEYPKLRADLEAFPIEHEGSRRLLLRDRTGLSGEQLVFAPQAAALLSQMNGTNSLRDLQAAHMRATGDILPIDDLREFVEKLDEFLFLENERFLGLLAKQRDDYLGDPVRRACHAGRSYPADPAELKSQLKGFFSVEMGGPGLKPKPGLTGRKLVGSVAPHIDLQGGGPCFAHAYRAVLDSEGPDTWIVLGTGHEYVENCFALTAKDFETPLGLVRCDAVLCEEIARRAPADIRASEYNHKTEHVIEFQAVFLAFTRPQAKIVPLLCSFAPEQWGDVREYVDAFAALL